MFDDQYDYFEVTTEGSPVQWASFMVDWCRRSYGLMRYVPKIVLVDGQVTEVHGHKAARLFTELYTFEQAFEINNGRTIEDLGLSETPLSYIYRPKGKVGGRHVAKSQFHLVNPDGLASRCGRVTAGKKGFVLALREARPMVSQTCKHCRSTDAVRS